MFMDVRHNPAPGYVLGAAILARSAKRIEEEGNPDESRKLEHKALVVGAIMQSVAALEADVYEVVTYGPGYHLGSGGTDHEAQAFLAPLWEALDRVQGGVLLDVIKRCSTF